MSSQDLAQFTIGRVVSDTGDTDQHLNPGHVIGFSMANDKIHVRVQFANGDRYNVLPSELVLL